MSLKQPRVAIVMHRWVGYLHGVQVGIARYVSQKPTWACIHVSPDSEQYRSIASMSFDGVLAYVESEQVTQLKSLSVPVVDVANWREAAHFPRVLPDDRKIGVVAAEHLVNLGLQHFGYRGYADAAFSSLRRDGFKSVLDRWELELNDWNPAEHPASDVQAGPGVNPSLLSWLRKLPKPVGVFCANDVAACEVLDQCRFAGLRVPEEVAILGVDDDELLTQISQPPISSVALQTQKIGFEAARLLDQLLHGEEVPESPILFPPVGVVPRQSTNLLAIDDEHVLAALKHIREHAHEPLRVDDLLKVVPINRRFLERRFREHLGRSPLQEIRRVRIETAKQLLSGSDLAMPAIARRSGFANAERFAIVFHAEIGMTPTQYRRKFKLHDT